MLTNSNLDCVCFTFIIDDIVFPDGRTCMAQLGGGGSQSLFGFQLVSSSLNSGRLAKLGLAAGVGSDVPESCLDWLHRMNVDTKGLIVHKQPTPRAWQVFEYDGRRTQVWRVPEVPELDAMLSPRMDNLPQHFKQALNYHIGVHPLTPPVQLLKAIRSAAHAAGGILSVEPYTHAERPPTPLELKTLLGSCDIFSPNLAEAQTLVGDGTPDQLTARLYAAAGDAAPAMIIIRCAEQGVFAQLGPHGPACMVPAVADTNVVDVTGAGNAFCGGFLAAIHNSPADNPLRCLLHNYTHNISHSNGFHANSSSSSTNGASDNDTRVPMQALAHGLATAAAWGCVASSHMIEEQGVPQLPLTQLQASALTRHRELMRRVVYMQHAVDSSTESDNELPSSGDCVQTTVASHASTTTARAVPVRGRMNAGLELYRNGFECAGSVSRHQSVRSNVRAPVCTVPSRSVFGQHNAIRKMMVPGL